MQLLRRAGASLLFVLTAGACSASSGPAGRAVGEDATGGSNNIPGNGGSSTGGSGGAIPTSGMGGTIPTSGTGGSSGDTCAATSTMGRLVKEPVDIVVILDNSGSMEDEMGAAETNINVNFAQILDTNSVDYRLILLSRHRDGPRGSEEENTSICVTQPLSGLATCPGPDPVFSDRFFHYSAKVESHDSFDVALEWYDLIDDDDDSLAPNGWGPWLRAGAKKVFVEMTDDNEDMPAADFMAALSAKSAEHFGTPEDPNYVFHSIVGLKEKANPTEAYLPDEPIESVVCTGNGAAIENPGTIYQELSVATGGLRFPLCQFPGYDAVFRQIATDVIVTSEIDCAFPIPAPPAGTELDLTKVAVGYKPGDGSPTKEYLQASSCDLCEPDAFCIPEGGMTIQLCDETCEALQMDPLATVDVLFKCESTIIPPR
jgi:hypothetical protein